MIQAMLHSYIWWALVIEVVNMKLGVKLVSGFLIVALVLIAIGGVAVVLQDKVKDVKTEVEELRVEQDNMLEFGFAIYDEYVMAVKCFTTFQVSEMDYYILEKNRSHAANLVMSNRLLSDFQERTGSELHEEIIDDFQEVQNILDYAHKCFTENSTLYAHFLLPDVTDVLITLNSTTENAMNNETIGINNIISMMENRISILENDENNAFTTLNQSILFGMIVAVVLAVGIGLALSNTMTSRLSNMIDAARKIKKGNMNVSVDEAGNDEIAELGKAFNQMIMSVRLVAGDMDMMDEPGLEEHGESEKDAGEPGN